MCRCRHFVYPDSLFPCVEVLPQCNDAYGAYFNKNMLFTASAFSMHFHLKLTIEHFEPAIYVKDIAVESLVVHLSVAAKENIFIFTVSSLNIDSLMLAVSPAFKILKAELTAQRLRKRRGVYVACVASLWEDWFLILRSVFKVKFRFSIWWFNCWSQCKHVASYSRV